jgi:hypothetical protein
MIAEFEPFVVVSDFIADFCGNRIVSNGSLSLPSALAVVGMQSFHNIFQTLIYLNQGIVPGVILIVFLGVFALYTAKLLIDFKAGTMQAIYSTYSDIL